MHMMLLFWVGCQHNECESLECVLLRDKDLVGPCADCGDNKFE